LTPFAFDTTLRQHFEKEDCGMRWTLGLVTVVAVLSAITAGNATADHIGQTLNCGTAGTYTIVGIETAAGFPVPIGETNLFLLGDTTTVLVIKEVSVDGQLRFANPGFQANNRTVVTCTFTGPRTGSLYTVTGILT